MDRLTILQDAIDRTEHAAARYDTGVLEIHGTDLLTAPEREDGWAAGALQRLLLDIADDHQACTRAGCRTCRALRDGLAVTLDHLHGMQRAELERRLKAPARRSWWRRALGSR